MTGPEPHLSATSINLDFEMVCTLIGALFEVLVAGNQTMAREGLQALLRPSSGIDVVGATDDEAVCPVTEQRPGR